MTAPRRSRRPSALERTEQRAAAALANLALLTGYAHVLTLDRARAHALVRETLYLEVFDRVPNGWLTDKLSALRCLRSVFFAYHGVEVSRRGDIFHRRAGARGARAHASVLSRALDELEVADRELLFLRFGAQLPIGQIAELTGREEAELEARVQQLCQSFPFEQALRRAQGVIEPFGRAELASIHAHLKGRRPARSRAGAEGLGTGSAR